MIYKISESRLFSEHSCPKEFLNVTGVEDEFQPAVGTFTMSVRIAHVTFDHKLHI